MNSSVFQGHAGPLALLLMLFCLCSSSRALVQQTPVLRRRLPLSSRALSASFPSSDTNEDDNNEVFQSNYGTLMENSKLQLAPMMEYTDRHFRHLVRLLSQRTLLYTEMVAANALAHERKQHIQTYQQQNPTASLSHAQQHYDDSYLQQRFLGQSPILREGPSVLQLGGSDPDILYQAAQTALELDQRPSSICRYTALNLNCGCPSPKVAGKGCFGAALMNDPALVAELTQALHDGVQGRLPITVKCRIGTDAQRTFDRSSGAVDRTALDYADLCRFIETVAAKGIVTDFSVHARIAVLSKKFSPADNRQIPPLQYDLVERLTHDYPEFTFSLNGGITSLTAVQQQLKDMPKLQGVMIGRAWAADPWSFAMADQLLYPNDNDNASSCPAQNRWQVLQDYGKHADAEEANGDPVKIRRFITKAVTPLFAGEPHAKRYRIALDEIAGLPKKLDGNLQGQPPLSKLILQAAEQHLSEETLMRTPQESYERMIWQQEQGQTRSKAVAEWQADRTAAAV